MKKIWVREGKINGTEMEEEIGQNKWSKKEKINWTEWGEQMKQGYKNKEKRREAN